MRDCLVLVDVFDDFGHEHGSQLLDSFLARLAGTRQLLRWARERRLPVVYANDPADVLDGDSGVLSSARGPALPADASTRSCPAPATGSSSSHAIRPLTRRRWR